MQVGGRRAAAEAVAGPTCQTIHWQQLHKALKHQQVAVAILLRAVAHSGGGPREMLEQRTQLEAGRLTRATKGAGEHRRRQMVRIEHPGSAQGGQPVLDGRPMEPGQVESCTQGAR